MKCRKSPPRTFTWYKTSNHMQSTSSVYSLCTMCTVYPVYLACCRACLGFVFKCGLLYTCMVVFVYVKSWCACAARLMVVVLFVYVCACVLN